MGQVSPVSIIPPYSSLNLHVSLTGWTNGRAWETYKIHCSLDNPKTLDRKRNLGFFFRSRGVGFASNRGSPREVLLRLPLQALAKYFLFRQKNLS